ncbi:MAG: hypothetical protein N2506_07830, partial [Dehalococcoidales bacterium]|nr:hypothetical protein [Dehalococcoidales bacterium]
MHIIMVGVDHRSAPVAVREKVAVGTAQLPEALSRLRGVVGCGVLLSTCNRTEIYTVAERPLSPGYGCGLLGACTGRDTAGLEGHLQVMADGQAVGHLFRVAGG